MAIKYALINNKGGTGKTTVTIHTAGALAERKYKVLVVDLDVQCNTSTGTGVLQKKENPPHHIGKLLFNESIFEQTVRTSPTISGVDVIPSNGVEMAAYEFRVNSDQIEGGYLLRQVLEQVESKYDFIIIDCPGNTGILTLSALVAADFYIIPIQGEDFALDGLGQIFELANKVIRRRMNTDLKLAGILPVKFNTRTRFGKQALEYLTASELRVFQNHIVQDIGLMESPSKGRSIFQYAPDSSGANAFREFTKELLGINP